MSFESAPSNSESNIADTGNIDESPGSELYEESYTDTGEQEFNDPERWARLFHELGGVSLEQTVDLQEELPEETPQNIQDEIEYDYSGDEQEDEEEKDKKDKKDEDEDELILKPLRKNAPGKKKQLTGDLTDDSMRDAALEFVYMATGMPVDELA